MNEEILKKLGYNSIALEMLLKREAQISPEDIIMPGQERSDIRQDYSNVEIILENLKSSIIQILNTAKSLPEFLEGEDGPDDSAYYDYRRSMIDSLEAAGSKLASCLIENNQSSSAEELDNFLQQ
jgi:hypothetical protein